MNKLRKEISKIKTVALSLFFIWSATVNAQKDLPENKVSNDTIPPNTVVSDTIPVKEQIIEPVDFKKPKKYTIGGVTVTGNQTISEQSILIFSGLVSGQQIRIPGDKLSSAIKKLWNSKLFSNVEVYATKVDGNSIYLEIKVAELSKVGKVTVKGLKKSKIDDLMKETEFQAGAMLTENLVTTTENYIENKYREKGFLNTKATISTKLDTTNTNTEDALVLIDKGEKVKIENITFHGNHIFSDKKLKKYLKKTKEKRIYNIFKPSKLVEDVYEEDIDNLIEKYQEKGFRDAIVIKDSISFNDNNTINLDITLTEGEKYKFGSIDFIGNSAFTDQQLQNILRIEEGVTYNGKVLNERVKGDGTPESNDISNAYYNNGYLFSNVDLVETSAENNIIDIEVRIHEDKPAHLNKITVIGNDVTNDHVLYREIRTQPGDLFSKQEIVRTIRELGKLGYIDPESIVPDVKPNHTDKTADIEYSVTEKGSSQVELQGGYGGGTFVGTLGLSFNNFSVKNIFNWDEYKPVPRGDGQSVSLRLQASKFSRTYSISFMEPWWGGKRPKGFNFSIYNSTQFGYNYATRDVNKDQMLDIIGASVGLSQRLKWPDDFFTLSTSVSYQRYNSKNFYLSSLGEGISNNLNFTTNFGRNSTGPSPIYPRYGSQFNLILEATPPYSSFNDKDYTGLSEEEKFEWLEYYKINFNGRWFSQIWKDLVLMSNAEFGFLGAYNDDIGVSRFERFYVGGDGMATGQYDGRQVVALRGYPNQSLSSYEGGTVFTKVAFELRYPVTLKPAASIYALAFLEGGNSYGGEVDINGNSKSGFEDFRPFDLKRSAGGGLRVFMPAFGLLGIDFGYGFDEVPGTNEVSGWQTHFIIGQQF
ncbi:MAG: outer membrane protein assembly factor BamA [Bacteroidota bacterium]